MYIGTFSKLLSHCMPSISRLHYLVIVCLQLAEIFLNLMSLLTLKN